MFRVYDLFRVWVFFLFFSFPFVLNRLVLLPLYSFLLSDAFAFQKGFERQKKTKTKKKKKTRKSSSSRWESRTFERENKRRNPRRHLSAFQIVLFKFVVPQLSIKKSSWRKKKKKSCSITRRRTWPRKRKRRRKPPTAEEKRKAGTARRKATSACTPRDSEISF